MYNAHSIYICVSLCLLHQTGVSVCGIVPQLLFFPVSFTGLSRGDLHGLPLSSVLSCAHLVVCDSWLLSSSFIFLVLFLFPFFLLAASQLVDP